MLKAKKLEKNLKNKFFWATLRPTKSFLQPPINFLGHYKVYSLNVWLNCGLFSYCGQINVKGKKKWKKIKKIYFPGPPYSLQKASYSLQFFLYVTLKHIVLLYAKIAGFLAIRGYFRPHKEKIIFFLNLGLLAPPPLIFGTYGTGATHLILVTKKGEKQNLPKTLKMAIFKRTFL